MTKLLETIDNNTWICYNYMPLLADKCIDLSVEEYAKWGVTRLHENKDIHPDEIPNITRGERLFIKTDFINSDSKVMTGLKNLKEKIILITGVSAQTVQKDKALQILNNPNIAHWFAANPAVMYDRLTPLPIGFEEIDRMPNKTQEILNQPYITEEKIQKIFLPYHGNTNPERNRIIQSLSGLGNLEEAVTKKLSFEDYLKRMSQYKFTACLPGSGFDIHRIYEALLVGSIPIVSGNSVIYWLEKNNIPYVNAGDWYNLMMILSNLDAPRNCDLRADDWYRIHDTLKIKYYADLVDEQWRLIHD